MAQYEYDKQIKQITSFILKLKEDIKDMNIFLLQKIENETMKWQLETVSLRENLLQEVQGVRDEINNRDEVVAIDNQRIQQTITDSFKPIEAKVEMVSKNMESVFSYIKEIEEKTQATVTKNSSLIQDKDNENKILLQEHKEELQKELQKVIENVQQFWLYVTQNNNILKQETLSLINAVDSRFEKLIVDNSKLIDTKISELDLLTKSNKEEIENIKSNTKKEVDIIKEKQWWTDTVLQEHKQAIDKNEKNISTVTSELEKVKKDVKKNIQPWSIRLWWKKWDKWASWVNGKSAYEIAVENWFEWDEEERIASLHGEDGIPWTPWEDGEPWITDPIILLSTQDFYIDTYNWNNQIEEAHREDGTTLVNTYNGNNQIVTAVYTLPDASTRTLTMKYDWNNRLLSALWS